MSSIQQSPDILAALQQRKKATARRIEASRQSVADASGQLPFMGRKAGGSHGVSSLVSNGIAFYEGARLFLSVVSVLRTLFGRRRRRR